MFIPRNIPENSPPGPDTHPVQLRAAHLGIQAGIFQELFVDAPQVYATFLPEKEALLIALPTNTAFKALYHPSLYLVKRRNAAGDRSIDIRDMLMDHNLDSHDRPLDYEAKQRQQVLHVYFHGLQKESL